MAAPITIHFFRHGDKDGDKLTPKGRDQALAAGLELQKTIPKNAIVKVYASPSVRTQQTGSYIIEGLGLTKHVRAPRVRYQLGIPPFTPAGEKATKEMGVEKYVEGWLKKTLPPETTGKIRRHGKEIDATAEAFGERLKWKAVDFAEKLNAKFEKMPFYKRLLGKKPIHIIYVTHMGYPEALAQHLTGKGVDELGGLSGHLEHLQIKVPAKGPLSVEYKGRAHEVRRRE